MRSPARGLALALLAVLAPLAALPPADAAGDEGNNFAVRGVSRVGDNVTVTVMSMLHPARVDVASLTVGGTLVATEHAGGAWTHREPVDLAFRLLREAVTVTLTIYYERGAGAARDVFTLDVPTEGATRRVSVVDAAVASSREVTLLVRNSGDLPVGRVLARLEDAEGARVGSPLERALDGLDVGDEAAVAFRVPDGFDEVVVVLEYAGRSESTKVRLRDAGSSARVSVVDATVDDAGVANVTLLNDGGGDAFDVAVALDDLAGVRVATPFRHVVPRLGAGERAALAFSLTKSASEVAVVVEDDGVSRTTRVHLRDADDAAALGGAVSLATDYPSRESAPSREAAFPLRLRNGGGEALVALRVVGLPDGYSAAVVAHGSSVPSLRVPAGATRDLTLNVAVPASATRDAGRTLEFAVVADVDGEEAARVPLTLTVVGTGKLELEGENWFAGLAPGESRTVEVTVRNSGTAPLRDVRLDASRPTGWRVAVEPERLERLDPGERRVVTVSVTAPSDAGAGKYVLDLAASTDDVASRARSLSLDVVAPTSSRLGWIAAVAAAGVLVLTVVVKIRRK